MNDLIKFMERCGKQIQKGVVWLLALLGTLLARVQKGFASIQVNFGQHIQKPLQNVTSLLVKGFKSLVKVAFAPVVFAEIFLVKVLDGLVFILHKILMQHGERDAWHRGNYKQVSNAVEANLIDGTKQIVFRTTEPGLATQDAMIQLLDWYHSDNETIPLVKAALFVYDFLSIHPFQDGNGRLSRLLGSLLLLKNGYSWIQYVSFEHEIESRKAEYYKVLMQTQRNRPGENITAWLSFFISCLININI